MLELTLFTTILHSHTMLATRSMLSLTLASTRSVGRVGLRSAPAMPTMALRSALTTSPRMVSTSSKSNAAAQTTKLTQQQNLDLLNQQRAQRPSSPHFTIYQPQITWLLSIINRITGTGLSVCKYLNRRRKEYAEATRLDFQRAWIDLRYDRQCLYGSRLTSFTPMFGLLCLCSAVRVFCSVRRLSAVRLG